MELVNIKSVLGEVDFQADRLLKEIKSLQEDETFQDTNELIEHIYGIVSMYIDTTKHGIEGHMTHYETVKSFSKRTNLNHNKIKDGIKKGNIKSLRVIDMKQFNNMSYQDTIKFKDKYK